MVQNMPGSHAGIYLPVVPSHAVLGMRASLPGVRAERVGPMASKLTKTRVNYRHAGLLARKKCGTCSMFREPDQCTLVRGPIRRRDVCDRFYPAR